jgi:tetratricopeptide (TPR) repeat protein
LTISATVQAILAARIDRLGPEAKRLLQAAAVIGKDVPMPLLLAIADAPEPVVRAELTHLQAAEFLYETWLFPDLEYTFKHALTHEVAYGSLLQDRRRTLHARIVSAIEALYPDRVTEQVERLAHHAFRGNQWAKAVAYLRHSGSKAAARSAHPEAVECLDQALEALGRLPASRETREQAIDIRFSLRDSLYPLGKVERILTCLDEAATLATALDDPARLAWVAIHMTNHYWVIGDNERAVKVGQAAPAIADTGSDLALQVEARYRLAQAHFSRGDYAQAIALLRWVIAHLEGERRPDSLGLPGFRSANAREWLGWCLAERGEFAEGISQVQEGMMIAEAVAHPFTLAGTCLGLGLLYLGKGDLEQAIPPLERSLGICQAWHTQIQWYAVAATLGHAYALSGRLAEALPLLEQAVSTRMRFIYPRLLASLGEGYLLAGRPADAREASERALTLARSQGECGHESRALLLLAQIAAADDSPQVEHSGSLYQQALALAAELGMRPLVAHCHLGLGKLYHRTDNREQAREHLNTATTMYRDMAMTSWLEQAEAEMSLLA